MMIHGSALLLCGAGRQACVARRTEILTTLKDPVKSIRKRLPNTGFVTAGLKSLMIHPPRAVVVFEFKLLGCGRPCRFRLVLRLHCGNLRFKVRKLAIAGGRGGGAATDARRVYDLIPVGAQAVLAHGRHSRRALGRGAGLRLAPVAGHVRASRPDPCVGASGQKHALELLHSGQHALVQDIRKIALWVLPTCECNRADEHSPCLRPTHLFACAISDGHTPAAASAACPAASAGGATGTYCNRCFSTCTSEIGAHAGSPSRHKLVAAFNQPLAASATVNVWGRGQREGG
eukprot:358114-Chlamydomonas_euryale.AAC.5